MPALVKIDTEDGYVLFEGEFSEAALQEISIQEKIKDVINATEATLPSIGQTVKRCTTDLLEPLFELAKNQRGTGALSQAVMELGITISGEGNVIVARGSAEANIKFTLTWEFS